MPDRRADLCRPGQNMFGTRYYYAATRGIGGRRLRAALLASSALAAVGTPAAAQNATWLAAPGSGDLLAGSNWSTGTVPSGTASFGASNTTSLSIAPTATPTTTIGGLTFNAGAPAYDLTISQTLVLNGAGIVVNGAGATITTTGSGGVLQFSNSSSAGTATISNGETTNFYDSSTAGSAAITNIGSLAFDGASTAANATITNTGSVGFRTTASGGNATIDNAGVIELYQSSTSGNATIANHSILYYNDTSSAGASAITNSASYCLSGR